MEIPSLPSSSSTASSSVSADDVVRRLSGFLEQRPTDFAITILSTASATPSEGQQRDNSTPPLLSLEESVVLVDGKHLGIDARSFPWMVGQIRTAYYRDKRRLATTAAAAAANGTDGQDPLSWLDLRTVTSCLLLVNPDHSTAWADRRRAVHGLLEGSEATEAEAEVRRGDNARWWHQELDFLDLLMTQHSKAPSSWAHRKYALRQILKMTAAAASLDLGADGDDSSSRSSSSIALFRRELRTCTAVAEGFPKNYYAWTHRRCLWEMFLIPPPGTGTCGAVDTGDVTFIDQDAAMALMDEELQFVWRDWLPSHTSDHSAVHYARQVLEMALSAKASRSCPTSDPTTRDRATTTSTNERCKGLEERAVLHTRSLIEKHPDQENFWILRRMTCQVLWTMEQPALAEDAGDERGCIAASSSNSSATGNNPAIRMLVLDDVQSVVVKLGLGTKEPRQESAERHEDDNDAHPWTFLAWCLANLPGMGDALFTSPSEAAVAVAPSDLKRQLCVILANHPNVSHRMWLSCGEELLN